MGRQFPVRLHTRKLKMGICKFQLSLSKDVWEKCATDTEEEPTSAPGMGKMQI